MSRVTEVVGALRARAEASGSGGKLPTFRALMAELRVSQATVSAALRVLESEGVIERRAGSGLYATRDLGQRPLLVVCDAGSFIGPSPFWELMMEGLVAPFADHPERAHFEFAVQTIGTREKIPVERLLSTRTWARLRAGAFAATILVCPDQRLGWAIEACGVPVVAFGCPAHVMIQSATLEACAMGVRELVARGCRRIALYNAPHVGAKEVFLGALSAHGASECVVPPTVGFRHVAPELGQRYRLVEGGLREANRLFGPESLPAARPDGILSVDDMFTQGLLMGMASLGLRPGEGVQIATHTNRGSPVLAAWKDQIVGIEMNPREIAAALHVAADALARGEEPRTGGWERSVLMQMSEGPLRTLLMRPRLRTSETP